jgi:hypothetical protein
VTEIIADQQLGWSVEPDEAAIAAELGEIYAAWKAKGHDGLSLRAVEQFDIRGTTGQLAGLFEEVSSAR